MSKASIESLDRHIGLQVREARLRNRLTIADVAHLAELSPGMLSKIENGQATASLDSLVRIANALGVTLGALFKGYGAPGGAARLVKAGEGMEVVRRGTPAGPETVYLGVVDALPKLVASAILVRAWQEAPGLRVVVREGLPGELFPALAAHQLDIVLANEPAPSSLKTLVHSTRAGRFGVHFVAKPFHSLHSQACSFRKPIVVFPR
jgi:transcriptional regulator with XRE-family HTH domain